MQSSSHSGRSGRGGTRTRLESRGRERTAGIALGGAERCWRQPSDCSLASPARGTTGAGRIAVLTLPLSLPSKQLLRSTTSTAENEPKMSAKKKKRLDAFIERKLKKEQRKDLIASLACVSLGPTSAAGLGLGTSAADSCSSLLAHRQTQTQSLNFASSSALGSRQFLSQASKLEHASAIEASRRHRAQKIVQRMNAGKLHLSDDEEDEDEGMEVDDERGEVDEGEPELDREFVKPQQALAITTAAPASSAKKHTQPFNPSGAVGVVVEPAAAAQPVASTSSAPAPAPAPAPAVGSALASTATVTVVRRKPKEKGRMRALAAAVGKGKGKKKQEEESEEEKGESSEFDSSEESEGGEGLEEDGEEEEWGGIQVDGEDEPRGTDDEEEDGRSGPDHEEEADEEEDGASEDEQDGVRRPPRERGSFRAWADAQVLAAAGLDSTTPATAADDDGVYKPLLPAGSGVKPAPLPEGTTGPLGAPLSASEMPTLPPQRTMHAPVTRTPEIEAQRAELPVVKEEDRVMAAIRGNAVVVICGETGSGKTTQIGQFLWEAGFGDPKSGEFNVHFSSRHLTDRELLADNPGMVAITQPRRVAALSTSARVRTELNLPSSSSLVAHRIRYSSTTSPDTKLVFMTDGVLLRELAADFLLSKYSVVVVDEAHERGVNTDVLIGVLSRVAKLREKQWKTGKEGAKVGCRSCSPALATAANESRTAPPPRHHVRHAARRRLCRESDIVCPAAARLAHHSAPTPRHAALCPPDGARLPRAGVQEGRAHPRPTPARRRPRLLHRAERDRQLGQEAGEEVWAEGGAGEEGEVEARGDEGCARGRALARGWG